METSDAVVDAGFDVEMYAAQYTGHTKLSRLMFIAERAAGQLQLDALRLAADEVKKTDNTTLYTQVIEKISGRLGPAYTLDKEHIRACDARAAQRLDKLEQELNQAKTTIIKENIRAGYCNLGDHYYGRGDLNSAFKHYARMRDYCQTGKHQVDMCLAIIRTGTHCNPHSLTRAEMGNFAHVMNYVVKAEQVTDLGPDAATVQAKLRTAAGLSLLDSRKFKVAARKLCDAPFEGADATVSGAAAAGGPAAAAAADAGQLDLLSPQDVALYGGLCALASFTRKELREQVLDNISFRSYLELAPAARELVEDFYNSRYASCLSALDRMRPALALDPHLHAHVPALTEAIRQRALVQYCAPFVAAELGAMAAAFNTSVEGVTAELESLIMAGQIQARIDSRAKVLHARHADARAATFGKAAGVGEDVAREARALLIRAALIQHDMVTRSKQPRGAGAMTDRGEMMMGMGPRMGRQERMMMGMLDRERDRDA